MNEKGFKRWGCSPAFTCNRSSTPSRGKILLCLLQGLGHAVSQLVEALLYKPEVSGFESGWCHWNFSLT